MKVTGIDTIIVGNPWKNWILVRLETDLGIDGIGEGTLEHRTLATDQAIRELADYVVGRDPANIEQLVFQMKQETYTPGILVHTIISAFEMACWDIMGKAQGVPVHRFFGGKFQERVPVYGNGWYRVERDPEQFQRAAEAALNHGFLALKFDPFGSVHGGMTSGEMRLAMNIVRAVKEVCDARGASIIVEGHARFDAGTAKRIARELEPFDPLWFEEPVFYTDIRGHAAVRQSTTVPIASGEHSVMLNEYVDFLQQDAIDILQPDIAHVGGLMQAKKIAALAEGFGKYCTFHSPLSPVVTAASLQLNAACPNAHIQECFDHFNPEWTHEIFGSPPAIEAGAVTISNAPGLGITVDWAKARKYPYASQNRQFMFRAGWEKRQGQIHMEEG